MGKRKTLAGELRERDEAAARAKSNGKAHPAAGFRPKEQRSDYDDAVYSGDHSDSDSSDNSEPLPESSPDWPAPPAVEAFHGLAGNIVRTLEPHSEADPVALLVQ